MKKLRLFLMIFITIVVNILLISGYHYSCKNYNKLHGTGIPPPERADKVHWCDECKAWAAAQKKPGKAPPPVIYKPIPKPVVAESECGPVTVARA